MPNPFKAFLDFRQKTSQAHFKPLESSKNKTSPKGHPDRQANKGCNVKKGSLEEKGFSIGEEGKSSPTGESISLSSLPYVAIVIENGLIKYRQAFETYEQAKAYASYKYKQESLLNRSLRMSWKVEFKE